MYPIPSRILAALLAAILLLAACSETSDPAPLPPPSQPLACSLAVTTFLTPRLVTLTYSLEASGVASISEVTYMEADGTEITVSNPSLPWEVSVDVPQDNGLTLRASAQGSVTQGSIELSINSAPLGDGGTAVSASDRCARNAN